MREKPDIVKILEKEEKLEKLQDRVQNKYEELGMSDESFENVPDETIEDIENTEKAGEDRIYSKKYDKSIGEILKIIQFTEKAATKIHGVTGEVEIYRLVMEEFKKSKEYSANIFLLTDDESKLSIMTSIKSKRVRAAERLTGLKQEGFKIPLSKAKTYSRVVREGETLHVKVSDVLNELFSRPNAYLIAKATGNIKNYDILTPLNMGGKIIGIFAMTSPSMVEEFIPLIKNLATHISASLELAKENTNRKEVEKSLKKSKERFRDVALSSADWMWEVDKDGKYTFTSGKVKNIFGYESSELLGKTPFDFMPEDEAKRVGEIFKEIASEKKPIVDLENWNLTKEGEKICLLTNGIPMLGENSELIGYRGVDKDITECKKTEEKFQEIFNGVSDAIFIHDLKDLSIIDVNDETCKRFGYTREEIKNMSIDDLSRSSMFSATTPESRELFKKIMDGEVVTKEWLSKNKDGDTFWHEMTVKLVEIEGEKRLLAIARNIDERKKAEEKIKYLKDYNENLLESNPNPIMVIKGYQIEYVNNSFVSTFGKTKDDYILKDMKEVIPVEITPAFEELLKEYNKKKELEVKGKSFSVSSFIVKKAEEEEERRGIIFQDITERKKAMNKIEKAKHELEAKNQELENTINYADRISLETKNALTELDQIFNSAADGMLVIDKDFHVLKMNDTFSTMFGISKAEAVGRKCYEVLNEPSCHSKLCSMKRMLDGTERVEFETEIKHTDGTKIPCNLTATSYKRADGEIIGIIENFKDITEWKKAEEKIKQQNIELEKLNQLKSVFLNITSHELRTPMSSIKGYIQMLLRRTFGEISDEQKSALEVILRNTNRLDHLIQDILDISRIESGTMKFIPEKTNLQKMLNEVAETMKSSAGLKEIKLNTDITKGLPDLFIDQERIKQVVINIVNNAIKFSPDESTINIRAKKEQNDILFEVQDFGRGIPQDKQERVFDTFYQVDSSKDTKFGGAGIGLAISRGIVLAHGGKIWVESKGKPEEGSTFRFTLPVKSVKDIESRFKKVDVFRLEKKRGIE